MNSVNKALLICSTMMVAQTAYGAIIPLGSQSISMRVNAYHNSDSSSQSGTGSLGIADSVFAGDEVVERNRYGDTIHSVKLTADAFAFASRLSIGASANVHVTAANGVTGFYGTGGTAFSQASLTRYFEVNAPGLTGQYGTMVVPLLVSGNILTGGASQFGTADNRAYALLWATGLAADNNCRSAAGACNEVSNYGGQSSAYATIPGTLTLSIPVRFGYVNNFSMELWASADATAVAESYSTVGSLAEVNFHHTVNWGGISNILDSNGHVVNGWTIQSEPGIDLTAPVPVPASIFLFLSGLGLLGLKPLRWNAPAVQPA
ncbi:hypothetical protein [Methylomonas koyamae]|uniref:hypothetical protein n=1 Tax=Methylomonas koyamae TaxID=702114 RepID=UPI00112AB30F|nr:hypothetical protein [Methylomonas koyamae]